MLSLEYGSKDFDRLAWQAIDRRDAVQLLIAGRKRSAVKRAIECYSEYVSSGRSGKRKRSLLLKFAWYVFRVPAFWGLHNHAELAGMQIRTEERDHHLVVMFLPPHMAPGGSLTH